MKVNKTNAVQNPDNSFNLTIADSGYADVGADWNAAITSPPYSRLYYTVSGGGEIVTENGTVELKPDTLCLLPYGYPFEYHCDSRMEQLYFHIHFTNSSQFDLLSGINQVLTLNVSHAHIDCLLKLYDHGDLNDIIALRSIINSDISEILREHNVELEPKSYTEYVAAAIKFIEENLSVNLTVKDISLALYVSPSTLSHKFKKELGMPIGKYIDNIVLYRAEQELLGTELSISEISRKHGFYDQFYFSMRFKEKFGCSPKKYRTMHKK